MYHNKDLSSLLFLGGETYKRQTLERQQYDQNTEPNLPVNPNLTPRGLNVKYDVNCLYGVNCTLFLREIILNDYAFDFLIMQYF